MTDSYPDAVDWLRAPLGLSFDDWLALPVSNGPPLHEELGMWRCGDDMVGRWCRGPEGDLVACHRRVEAVLHRRIVERLKQADEDVRRWAAAVPPSLVDQDLIRRVRASSAEALKSARRLAAAAQRS